MNHLFGKYAFQYWEAGFSPIPLKEKQKIPAIRDWASYGHNRPNEKRMQGWLQEYESGNLGLVMGGPVTQDHTITAIDIDDDKLMRAGGGALGRGAPQLLCRCRAGRRQSRP